MVAKRAKTSPTTSSKKQKKEKDELAIDIEADDAKDIQDKKEKDMLKERIEKVRNVIEECCTDPEVKELLVKGVDHCFGDFVEKRHPIRSEFIGMIETDLLQYVHEKEKEKNVVEEKIANADKIKEENMQTKNDLTAQLEAKNALIDSKQVEVDDLEKKNNEAKESKDAKKAETEAALAPMNHHQEELKETEEKQKIFEDLRTNNPNIEDKNSKKLISQVTSYVTKMGAASSLTISAPVALMKKIRSDFDTKILDEIQELFTAHASKLKTNIESENVTHKGVLAELQAAEEAAKSALEAFELATEQLEELKKEKRLIQESLKEIEKKIKSHDKDMKKAQTDLDQATSELQNLQGVYQSAIDMRDKTNVPKVPEVSENQQEEQEKEEVAINIED